MPLFEKKYIPEIFIFLSSSVSVQRCHGHFLKWKLPISCLRIWIDYEILIYDNAHVCTVNLKIIEYT